MIPSPDAASLPESSTLEQVAKAAGVSPATVSRILNGTARVSDKRREAVEKAIKQLNYRPNALARGLARGRTNSIGVLTQDIGSPYYAEAHRGIEAALSETGMVPLFASGHWRHGDELDRMEHLLSRQVDGVIVLTGHLADEELLRYAKQVPIVVTGRDLSAPNLVSLRVDDYEGARLAVQHLIGQGHKRIAHISGLADHADADERLRGYRDALAEAGLPWEDELVANGDYHEDGGIAAMRQLLDRGVQFTAIFAANDQSAQGARLVMHQQGVRVPEDVSLVGFDDVAAARFMVPPLTTIRQPTREMGLLAARLLGRLIAGEPVPAQTLPGPELVMRASTRSPR